MAEYKILKPNADGDYDNNARIDISVANEQLIFDVAGWNTLTLQAVSDGAVTVGSLALKIQVSNDGANPNDFPSGAVTRSTAGISAQLSVTAYKYVHAKVTTAGTSGIFRFIARASKIVA